jgi:hypothetical protein
MNKALLAFLAIIIMATVSAQKAIKDPNVQLREAKNFHGIRISNAFDVYLSQGNEEAVAVSASEVKFLDKIIVEVKNGILDISLEKSSLKLNNKKLKAYISFKNIDRLNVSGACNVVIDGVIKADNLKLGLSGASDLRGKLDVNKLRVDLSGASDMSVTGTATQLDIEASGVSKFKGFDMVTDYCNANASGATDIKITVNKELSVDASGVSDIDYKGEGVIRTVRTSGASSVSRQS